MPLIQPLLYMMNLQLWLSTGHVEMVANDKILHVATAQK